MEIRHLKIFRTVVKLLSFNRAAQQFTYAQSSISAQIQAVDIEVKTLGFETVVMVAPLDHPLASRPSVKTGDLEEKTVLLSRVDCSYRKTFERLMEEEGIGYNSSLVFHSMEALKRSVMEGAGITVLPKVSVVDNVAVLMIWYKEKWISPTLRAFMETTRNYLGDVYSK